MSNEQVYSPFYGRSFPKGSPWLDEHCKLCGIGTNFALHQNFCEHAGCPYKPQLGDETDPATARGRAAAVLRRATRKGVQLRAYTGDISILLDEIAAELASQAK